MNDFQERLNELMIDKHINRLQLSKKLNISAATINGYFNKNYYPKIEIAIKIVQNFGCNLDYLFGFSDSCTPKEYANDKTLLSNFLINFKKLIGYNNASVASIMRDLQMSEYNYYRWRKGQFPKTINLLAVAKYFDVGVDYLLEKDKTYDG